MRKYGVGLAGLIIAASAVFGGGIGRAEGQGNGARNGCRDLPSWGDLRAALVAARNEANGGLNLDMWGTIVDRDGVVCAVAFTGSERDDQWPGSRVISAQKANTANAFSLRGLALSTANLFTAVQPGGSLFGLQESNPVSTLAAYGGSPDRYGRSNDPMVGERIGGVNVFGGGLALYDSSHAILGGVGVSGDTSCADHNIAYRTRATLRLDYVPAGVSPIRCARTTHLRHRPARRRRAARWTDGRRQRRRVRPCQLPRLQRRRQHDQRRIRRGSAAEP